MPDKKILLVDDDEDLHTLYGLFLQGESYRIARAYNGRQALEALNKERPDLIVLDMIMPVMTGEEFLGSLQNLDSKLKNTPIIIASVNEKIPRYLFQCSNIRATLKKPFTVETLVSKIREALE